MTRWDEQMAIKNRRFYGWRKKLLPTWDEQMAIKNRRFYGWRRKNNGKISKFKMRWKS